MGLGIIGCQQILAFVLFAVASTIQGLGMAAALDSTIEDPALHIVVVPISSIGAVCALSHRRVSLVWVVAVHD